MVIVTNKNVKKFISNLQKDTQSKVLRYVELLKKFGPNLRMPYAKRITKDLYELRIRGKQETRIFYTIRSNKAFLLQNLHGYESFLGCKPKTNLHFEHSSFPLKGFQI